MNNPLYKRFLLFLAGAAPREIEKVTSFDLMKLYFLGMLPFIPAIMAYIGGGIAALMFLPDAPFLAWFVIAPTLGLSIFILEVAVNASMSPGAAKGSKLKTSIPRIACSLLLSLTLALPLKLAIFSGPIQLQLDQQLAQEIRRLETHVGPALTEARSYRQQTASALAAKAEECRALRAEFVAEIDGLAPNSPAGIGPIAEIKRRHHTQCITARDALAQSNAKALTRLNQIEAEQSHTTLRVIRAAREQFPRDLMAQLRAFEEISKESGFLKIAGVVIFLLLTSLDTLPTIIKITTHVPSYTVAERVALHHRMIEWMSLRKATRDMTEEQSKSLIYAAAKDRELDTLKTTLKTFLRTLDITGKTREDLDMKSVRHQLTDKLDPKPFEHTMDDIQHLSTLIESIQDLHTEPSDTHKEPETPMTNDSINFRTTQPRKPQPRATDRPPRKPFTIKKIV